MRKSTAQQRKEQEERVIIDSLCEALGGSVNLVDTGRGIYITQEGKCLRGAKIGLVDDSDRGDDCE